MITTLSDLFLKVDERLRSSSTLASCYDLLAKYDTDNHEWRDYIKFDTQTYTRILIPNMSNEILEVFLICWDKNQKSPIHNHPENGCILKVLQGELIEDIYVAVHKDTYLYKKSIINSINSISYMCGDDVIHKISNTNANKNDNYQTVSLHIYSPPKFKYTIVPSNKINKLV